MASVKGLAAISAALTKAFADIEGDIAAGLDMAGAHVEGEAVVNAPVEFGDMRRSSFHDVLHSRRATVLRVGFTSEYAAFVHEAPMKLKGKQRAKRKGIKAGSGNYWDGGDNKFLERAVKENQDDIIKIVAKYAAVK